MTLVPASQPDLAPDASLSVAAVAAIVGVAPSTLRTWARRYGLEPSGHRSGLHRRYTRLDLDRLQLMRSLTRAGLSTQEAAGRALDASREQLALAAAARRHGDHAVLATSEPAPVAATATSGPRSLEELERPVRALLATVGRGDARGAAALLRHSLREIGAARTYDERVRPVREALMLLPGPIASRAASGLVAAVAVAVGEPTLRREARNTIPVAVGALPGADDRCATALLRAALAERAVLSEVWSGVDRPDQVVVLLARRDVAQPPVRPAQLPTGMAVVWGPGWIHRPDRAASLVDVVQSVERLAAPTC